MRPAGLLVGLSAAALTLTATPAHAATGLVDGIVGVGGATCSWTDAVTSDVPPNTLTIDRTTVDPDCDGGVEVTLTNDPTIIFDDVPPATAWSPEVSVTGRLLGISCSYKVTNATFQRQGTSRTYVGGPFTATKTSGSFLCPSSETVDSVTFTFH